jgi:hypothetical protein
MIRNFTLFAVCELALLATFLGLPAAKADPAMMCCGVDKHEECSGCQSNYLIGNNTLYGCMEGGIPAGCEETSLICFQAGPIMKWKRDCTYFDTVVAGVAIGRQGCPDWLDCN